MKIPTITLVCLLFLGYSQTLSAQQDERPAYCDYIPSAYDQGAPPPPKASLPKFATTASPVYKVQVAVLREDPSNYPFHSKLVARYRPCEQLWVVESKETCQTREEAEALKAELSELGYSDSYITSIVSFKEAEGEE